MYKFVFLPNEFDNCPLKDAVTVLEKDGQERYDELKQRSISKNWSRKRMDAEIRNLADEVYWTAKGDE